jgi:hypothetical protein
MVAIEDKTSSTGITSKYNRAWIPQYFMHARRQKQRHLKIFYGYYESLTYASVQSQNEGTKIVKC